MIYFPSASCRTWGLGTGCITYPRGTYTFHVHDELQMSFRMASVGFTRDHTGCSTCCSLFEICMMHFPSLTTERQKKLNKKWSSWSFHGLTIARQIEEWIGWHCGVSKRKEKELMVQKKSETWFIIEDFKVTKVWFHRIVRFYFTMVKTMVLCKWLI